MRARYFDILFSLVGYLAWLLSLSSPLCAQELDGNRYVKSSLVVDHDSLQPSQDGTDVVGRIGVYFEVEPGWHMYWRNSGEAAIPTRIDWHTEDGWSVGALRWPTPLRFIEKGNITTFGYRDEVLLLADILAPAVVPSDDDRFRIRADVRWLVCKDICVPGRRELSLDIPFNTTAPLSPSSYFEIFERYDAATPRPVADLRVDTQFALSALPPGEPNRIFLDLQGSFLAQHTSTALAEQAALFQVFPGPNALVTFDEPFLATRSQLVLPFELNPDTPLGPLTLEGDVSFPGPHGPRSVPWKLTLAVAPPSAPPGIIRNNTGVTPDATFPLSYRRVVPAEHDAAEAIPPVQITSTEMPHTSVELIPTLLAILSAFVAGLVLNLMPCVLPIISIKLMAFAECCDKSLHETKRQARAFALGILSSFLALAIAVISLRKIGVELGWGFQFQHPGFVFVLLVIVFVLGLAFFDVYYLNLPGIRSASKSVEQIRSPFFKHFFDGVLATALSTPCTAPFLGTALAFAFASPPALTICIFLAIGLGLALPYVVMSTHPRILALLPQPGNWMIRLREFMGFLLLATSVWLLHVLHRLAGEGALWALVVVLIIAFCLWAKRWVHDIQPPGFVAALLSLLLFGLAAGSVWKLWPMIADAVPVCESGAGSAGDSGWQNYSPERAEALRGEGRTVFIDFTAAWCITCKANEALVIESAAVRALFTDKNVALLKADWTSEDPVVTAALRRYGGNGVPHYVLLPAQVDASPIILPTLLTTATIREALAKAAG